MRANVLIQTAFLGDLLLSIPLIRRLKQNWPDHKLILVCRRGVGDFFLRTQLVDEVLEIKKGDSASYEQAKASLNQQSLDKVFSTHGSLRTALLVRGLTASEKVGFSTWWNGVIYRRRVSKDLSLPESIRQLSLLSLYDNELNAQIENYKQQATPYIPAPDGRLPTVPEWASMSLKSFYPARRSELTMMLERLALSPAILKRSVALFPGSVWATKRWTKEGFVALGNQCVQEGLQVLVMGGPGEESLCAAIAALIPGSRDLCAKTSIFESALVLSRVSAVVGNDSASLHLAATCETPSVVAFGPTVLEFGFRPWQDQVFVAEINDLPCRPCGKHGHQVCPIGTHACMKRISADDMATRLQSALASRHSSV